MAQHSRTVAVRREPVRLAPCPRRRALICLRDPVPVADRHRERSQVCGTAACGHDAWLPLSRCSAMARYRRPPGTQAARCAAVLRSVDGRAPWHARWLYRPRYARCGDRCDPLQAPGRYAIPDLQRSVRNRLSGPEIALHAGFPAGSAPLVARDPGLPVLHSRQLIGEHHGFTAGQRVTWHPLWTCAAGDRIGCCSR